MQVVERLASCHQHKDGVASKKKKKPMRFEDPSRMDKRLKTIH
jgi:hypothetical protein